jgi:hypothetical protein
MGGQDERPEPENSMHAWRRTFDTKDRRCTIYIWSQPRLAKTEITWTYCFKPFRRSRMVKIERNTSPRN